MAVLDYRDLFDEIAVDGVLGDIQGKPAYLYCRVSSDEQGEQGRDGVARQLRTAHEFALKNGWQVPYEFVYVDDYTGELIERPSLDRLRDDYSTFKKSDAVMIEHVDRLTRGGIYHLGYLLTDMGKYDVRPIFVLEDSDNPIVQAVYADGSKNEREKIARRVKKAKQAKAKSGRITASYPAIGYRFVNRHGGEDNKDEDTHYAIDETRRACIEFIFNAAAYQGLSCKRIVRELERKAELDSRYSPPRGKVWYKRTVLGIIRNPLYKGQYAYNRQEVKKLNGYNEKGNRKVKTGYFPENEWQFIDVPAIVDTATWEQANANVNRNRHLLSQNRETVQINQYLLQGLIQCTCGCRYRGHAQHGYLRYVCGTRYESKSFREAHPCKQPSVKAVLIENAVWNAIVGLLLDPETVDRAIEERYSDSQNEDIRRQALYFEQAAESKMKEVERLHAAYLKGAFEPKEYADMRRQLISDKDRLLLDAKNLTVGLVTREEIEARKKAAKFVMGEIRGKLDGGDLPFELKQRVVRLLVSKVILNANEGKIEIQGSINGTYNVTGETFSTRNVPHIAAAKMGTPNASSTRKIPSCCDQPQ